MNDQVVTTEAQSRRVYRLRETPFMLRWTVVFTQLFVPFVLYLVVSALFSYQYSIGYGVAFSFVGMLAATIVTGNLLLRGGSVLVATLTGVLVAFAVLVGWLATSQIQPLTAFYLGLIAYTSYRTRTLATADSASEVNRRTFRFDSVVLIVIVSLFALSSSGLTSPTAITVSEMVALLLLLYVFARIYTLWRFERLETGTKGASRAGLYIVLGAAVILALWGPFVLVHSVFILLAIAGSFQLFWLWIWSLFGIDLTPHGGNPQSTTIKSNPRPNLPPAAHGLTPHQMNTFLLIIGVVIAVVALAALFLSKRKQLTPADKKSDAAEITNMTRKWVRQSKSFTFLKTKHPIRLEYQSWLRRQQQQGIEVSLNESARQLLSKDVDEGGGRLRELIPLYEQARYQQATKDLES